MYDLTTAQAVKRRLDYEIILKPSISFFQLFFRISTVNLIRDRVLASGRTMTVMSQNEGKQVMQHNFKPESFVIYAHVDHIREVANRYSSSKEEKIGQVRSTVCSSAKLP